MQRKFLHQKAASQDKTVTHVDSMEAADCHCCYGDVSTASSTGRFVPADLTVNNNAHQLLKEHSNGAGSLKIPNVAPQQQLQRKPHRVQIMTTFADYVRLQEKLQNGSNCAPESKRLIPSRSVHQHLVNSSQHASESVDFKGQQSSIFNRPQLTTFSEYQERTKTKAEHSTEPPTVETSGENDQTGVDTPTPEENQAAVAAATAVIDNEDDTGSVGSGGKHRTGCCACCSRGRRDRPDAASRRKRRLVGQEGVTSGTVQRDLSLTLECDADMIDVKDMDPTITLMPYVLFESERSKVLYQTASSEEAELLKKAIAMHANDLYKKVLMRLYMYRYLKLFQEGVVRSVLSKKIIIGHDDARAANVLGIDIVEDMKTSGTTSPALSIGMAYDSKQTEMMPSSKRSAQLADSCEMTRQMFKPAPRLTDLEILDLLNDGKIIDVTNRASLESLVSVETTKLGQRKSA